jgi:hypothetical protein
MCPVLVHLYGPELCSLDNLHDKVCAWEVEPVLLPPSNSTGNEAMLSEHTNIRNVSSMMLKGKMSITSNKETRACVCK